MGTFLILREVQENSESRESVRGGDARFPSPRRRDFCPELPADADESRLIRVFTSAVFISTAYSYLRSAERQNLFDSPRDFILYDAS